MNSELCDVELIVGAKQFYAHKLILAGHSAYFKAMFTGSLQESTRNEITLKGVDPADVETLLKYMYESALIVTEENAISVLTLAAQWQMDEIVHLCGEFIVDSEGGLTVSNCIQMITFADVHGCPVLEEGARLFYIRNFSDICQTSAFVETPTEVLVDLLNSEFLKIQSEEKLLEDILRWFQNKPYYRRGDVVQMLQLTRYPLIPWEVLSDRLVANSLDSEHECKVMVEKARHFQMDPEIAIDPSDSLYVQRRSFLGEAKPIYILSKDYTIFEFDVISKKCKKVTVLPVPMAGYRSFGMCVCQGLLYFLGGCIEGELGSRRVFCYDPKSKKWNERAEMVERYYNCVRHGTGVINGKLYAIGGEQASVQMYDPDTDMWCLLAPMGSGKYMSDKIVATINTKMYVVEAEYGRGEVYDSTTDQWSDIQKLYPHAHECKALCVMDGLLHAVCYSGAQRVCDVYMYHPDRDFWSVVSRIPYFVESAVAVQGRIYTFGFIDTPNIKCFDPKTNKLEFALEIADWYGCFA